MTHCGKYGFDMLQVTVSFGFGKNPETSYHLESLRLGNRSPLLLIDQECCSEFLGQENSVAFTAMQSGGKLSECGRIADWMS